MVNGDESNKKAEEIRGEGLEEAVKEAVKKLMSCEHPHPEVRAHTGHGNAWMYCSDCDSTYVRKMNPGETDKFYRERMNKVIGI